MLDIDFEDEAQEEQPESIEETILKSVNEVTNENAQTDQQVDGQSDEETEIQKAARTLAGAKKNKRKTIEGAELSPEPAQTATEQPEVDLQPPQRFTLEMKEKFNKYPADLKKQYLEDWGNVQRYSTQLWQETNREKDKYTEINQIVDHYIPKWGMQGLTPQAAVAEMFAMQDRIIKDPLAAYALMLEKSGITPEMLYEYRENGGAVPAQQPQQQNFQQEQNNFLTKEELYETMQEWRQQEHEQAAVGSAAYEVQAVKQEMSADGRYLWPELHDLATVERVKPLVSDLMETQQGISWADATKRAIQTLRYLNGNTSSPSHNGSRLPTTNTEQINKLKAASVSVSGRGNANKPIFDPAPENESVEETIMRTFAGLNINY